MSFTERLTDLWNAYQRERRLLLPKEAFQILLEAFPALLVAQADGFTDATEFQRLEEIIAFLCKQESVSLTAIDWTAELRYLAVDSDFWRKEFLETLRLRLKENPLLYKQQAEFMYATAAASTGDAVQNLLLRLHRRDLIGKGEVAFISDREYAEIERLIQELDFASAPEALEYLRGLLNLPHA